MSNAGTRFMLTRESAIHDNIKPAMLTATEHDTTLIKRTARYFSNPVSRMVSECRGSLQSALGAFGEVA
ncbi:hypothetical protein D3C81_1818700 [compost metagenome]